MTTNNIVMEKTIKLKANDVQHEISVRMDFENVSRPQLLSWAFADRIIAMQRVLRECSNESLAEFVQDGYNVHALAAGQKPRTFNETKNDIKSHMATLSTAEREALLEELLSD